MVEADESFNAGEIEAPGVERRLGMLGCKSHGRGCRIHECDCTGVACFVDGLEFLAGMMVDRKKDSWGERSFN